MTDAFVATLQSHDWARTTSEIGTLVLPSQNLEYPDPLAAYFTTSPGSFLFAPGHASTLYVRKLLNENHFYPEDPTDPSSQRLAIVDVGSLINPGNINEIQGADDNDTQVVILQTLAIELALRSNELRMRESIIQQIQARGLDATPFIEERDTSVTIISKMIESTMMLLDELSSRNTLYITPALENLLVDITRVCIELPTENNFPLLYSMLNNVCTRRLNTENYGRYNGERLQLENEDQSWSIITASLLEGSDTFRTVLDNLSQTPIRRRYMLLIILDLINAGRITDLIEEEGIYHGSRIPIDTLYWQLHELGGFKPQQDDMDEKICGACNITKTTLRNSREADTLKHVEADDHISDSGYQPLKDPFVQGYIQDKFQNDRSLLKWLKSKRRRSK